METVQRAQQIHEKQLAFALWTKDVPLIDYVDDVLCKHIDSGVNHRHVHKEKHKDRPPVFAKFHHDAFEVDENISQIVQPTNESIDAIEIVDIRKDDQLESHDVVEIHFSKILSFLVENQNVQK